MEAPVAQNNNIIGSIDGLEIELMINQNGARKNNLIIDSFSAFDMTPRTATRKPLGSTSLNQLKIFDKKLTFDKVNDTYHTAFHIHNSDSKDEGVAVKLTLDPISKNLDVYLYKLTDISLSLLKKATWKVNNLPDTISVIKLLLTLINNDWNSATISITSSERTRPIAPQPAPAGKAANPKWKFWNK